MGLEIRVFDLANRLYDDETEPEEIEEIKERFDQLNEFLRSRGLPEHIEPEKLPDNLIYRGELTGFHYSSTHFLRRAYAYQQLGLPLIPFTNKSDDAKRLPHL
ncbi:hypothetical protein V2H45_21030 [Tumidithrix elongata RA019]|uniref:Uncharacterized protein n=1 Tax=Tumidithrix elongata BACA0141 TaxID=2716417 RepID=A0AAW9Q5P5_9CYAN|nr:hypothetical protein [Tumidithrix elongata RA019]